MRSGFAALFMRLPKPSCRNGANAHSRRTTPSSRSSPRCDPSGRGTRPACPSNAERGTCAAPRWRFPNFRRYCRPLLTSRADFQKLRWLEFSRKAHALSSWRLRPQGAARRPVSPCRMRDASDLLHSAPPPGRMWQGRPHLAARPGRPCHIVFYVVIRTAIRSGPPGCVRCGGAEW